MIEAYPLSWPAGWPRTPSSDRKYPRFHRTTQRQSSVNPSYYYRQKADLTVSDSVSRVIAELITFGVSRDSIIISTNIETRNDGLPRSDRRALDGDPGVAVYWADPDSGQQQAMAIDLYTSVAGNLAAVAATIDAMRAIERHGGAQILKRAFEGFKALPAAGGTIATLSTGQAATLIARLAGIASGEIEERAAEVLKHHIIARNEMRVAKAKTHPDAGGRNEDWTLLQEAERIITAHHGGKL